MISKSMNGFIKENDMKVAIFTFTRAEYGLLRWTIKKLKDSDYFDVELYVGGAHLSSKYGSTIQEILNDNISADHILEFLIDGDSPDSFSKSVGIGIISLSQMFVENKPDVLIILGDRYELYTVVIPAILWKIPIIHIAGGERTLGVVDEQIRHSITKSAHIHVVSTEKYAENVSKMGEEDWRIQVLGAPGIENIYRLKLLNLDEIRRVLDVDLSKPTFLVTYHPVTLELNVPVEKQIDNLITALDNFKDFQVIFTASGAETSRNVIVSKIQDYVDKNPDRAYFFKNLGSQLYLSVMRYSKAVVGNSSSGIIEAPSLKIPTVNIGERQKGRIKAESVIDCDYSTESIIRAIEKAVYDEDFLDKVSEVRNPYDPYGDGNFSGRFLKIMKNLTIDEKLMKKDLDFRVIKTMWNSLLKE